MANNIIAFLSCLSGLLFFVPPASANSPVPPDPAVQADFKTKDKIIIYIQTLDRFDFAASQENNTFESRDALCEEYRLHVAYVVHKRPVSVECYKGEDHMAFYKPPSDNVIALKLSLTRQMLNGEKIAVVVMSYSTKAVFYHGLTLPYVYKYSADSVYLAPETKVAFDTTKADVTTFLGNHLMSK